MYLLEKLNTLLLLILGSLALATAGPAIDRQFPVVHPFVVTTVSMPEASATTIEIAGWAKKLRDCKPIEVTILAYNKEGIASLGSIEYLDLPSREIPSRPKSDSVQTWGPWRITVPINTEIVDISALHRCHVLWDTRTKFTTLNLKDYK